MMRSSMKRTLALLLTIVMVMGLVVVPAGAARPMGGEVAETPAAATAAAPSAGGKSAGTVGVSEAELMASSPTPTEADAGDADSRRFVMDAASLSAATYSSATPVPMGTEYGEEGSKTPYFTYYPKENNSKVEGKVSDAFPGDYVSENGIKGGGAIAALDSRALQFTVGAGKIARVKVWWYDGGSGRGVGIWTTNTDTDNGGRAFNASKPVYRSLDLGGSSSTGHVSTFVVPDGTWALGDFSSQNHLCKVEVQEYATSAGVEPTTVAITGPSNATASTLDVGTEQTVALTAAVTGAGDAAALVQDVTWTSDNAKVTVSDSGEVTVAANAMPGTATITATSVVGPKGDGTYNSMSATYVITLNSNHEHGTTKPTDPANLGAWTVVEGSVTPATCGADGSETIKCAVDGCPGEEITLPATGEHDDDHGVCTVCRRLDTSWPGMVGAIFKKGDKKAYDMTDKDVTTESTLFNAGMDAGSNTKELTPAVAYAGLTAINAYQNVDSSFHLAFTASSDGVFVAYLSGGTDLKITNTPTEGEAVTGNVNAVANVITKDVKAGTVKIDRGSAGASLVFVAFMPDPAPADPPTVVAANLGDIENSSETLPANGLATNYTVSAATACAEDGVDWQVTLSADTLTKHVRKGVASDTAKYWIGIGVPKAKAANDLKAGDTLATATNAIGVRTQEVEGETYYTAYTALSDATTTNVTKTFYLKELDGEDVVTVYKVTVNVGTLIDPDHTYALTVGAETLTMKMGVAEYESISFTSTDTANGGSAEAVNPTVVSADSTKVTATLNNADDDNNSILIRALAATTTPVNVTVTNGNKVKTIAVTVVASDATEGYTIPTQWNFKGDEIGMVYQATGKFRGLDISSGTHIRPGDNGLQFYDAGGTVSIPVTGASKITVTGAHASGKLWMADSDVPEATPVDGKVGDLVFIYTGTGPAVLTTGAGGACIAAIKVEEYQAPATPVITAKVTGEEDGTLTKTLTAVKSGDAFPDMSVTASVSDNSTPTYKWTKGNDTTSLATTASFTPNGTVTVADDNDTTYKCTVSAEGAEDVVLTFTVKVNKADGSTTKPTGFTATGCKADGTKGTITGTLTGLEYKKDNGDWTAIPNTGMTELNAGSYYFRQAATAEQEAGVSSDAVVVTKAMAYTAPNVTATYDGTAKKIAVTVTDPAAADATVKYSETEGSYTTTEIEVTDANVDSPKTVYFEITAEGYTTETGSATITVNKAAAPTITVRANLKKVAVTGGTVTFTAAVTGLVAADEANPTAISANCSQGKTFSITKGATGWSGTNTIEASDGTEKTHTVSFTWTNANYTAPSIADVVITQLAEDAVVPVVAEDLQIWTQTLSTGGTAPDYAALGIAAKAENNIVTINIDEAKILTAFADEAKKAIFQAVPKMNHNGTAYLMFQFKAPTGVANGWKIQQVITKDGGMPDEGDKWTVSEASDAAGDLNYNLLQGGTARYVGDWFGVLTGVTGSEQGMPTTGTYEVAYNFFDGDTVKNIVELTVVREVTAAKALSITANNATATVTNTGVYNKTAAAAGMKVSPAEDVVIELTAADNYDLPETASVQIGSADASDVAIADGKITIAKASITGDITVTVTATKQKMAKPASATIDYAAEKLTVANGKYKVDGAAAITVSDGKIDIADKISTSAGTVSLVAVDPDGNKDDSEALEVAIPARPDTPTGTGVAPTAEGGTDGKITGLTANAIYSVKKGADAATDKTADADGVITGLAAGSYTVTLKATDSAFASAASATITVADGPSAPTNFTVTYVAVADEGTVSITDKVSGLATTVADGGKVTLPAADDMAVDGYTFVKWTKDSGTDAVTGEQTITADTTFKANYTKNVATPDPEYSDLAAAIEAAEQALKDANIQEDDVERSSIKKGTEFVHKTDADAYQAAIDVAKQVDENADTDAIIAALAALKTATEAFENATLTGTKSSGIGVIGGGGGGATTPATTTKTETLTDGTKRVTETAKDGTVTTTDTKPDGTKLVSTTTPDGDTTTKVTLPKGTESATVSVPVEKEDSGLVAIKVNPDGTEEVIRDSVVVDGEMVFEAEDGETVKIANKAKHFVDIDGHWAEKNVDFVTARDLFNGVDATHFSPDTAMTRGMMATVLFRLDGELKADKAADFADVKDGDWYDSAVDWAADAGVINGYTDGTFAPNRAITREELVLMVYRYAGTPAVDGTKGMTAFTDVDTISTWAADAMRWAVQNGIINGKGNGTIDPKANATRAEVSAVLERYVKLAAK